MKAWRVHEYGEPIHALRLEDCDEPQPSPREIQVRVQAVALNFNDLDGVRGRYKTVSPPLPYTPGMEVLGVVSSCGSGAEEWMGRRVVAIPSGACGGYAEVAVAPVAMAFEMPASVALPDAAAIYMPFHLAWLALYERAKVQSSETLLVHAAAGGAGSAALQLGVHAGAKVIATAGSTEKVRRCTELGAAMTINYRERPFADEVMRMTDGRGVDIAFDTVGGQITEQTFGCMAFNGRHILAGFASGIEAEDEGIVPRPILFGNFSLVGVCHAYTDDAVALKQARGFNFPTHDDGERVHAQLLELIGSGAIRPLVDRDIDFEQLPTGLEAMGRRETVGRVIVRL
ncbi:MAG: NADPH:quinone oxidoreductase family protein [Acidimicrobiales bacterium]